MSKELQVDAHYQGIELGQQLHLVANAKGQLHLKHPAPMPVGTSISLVSDGKTIDLRVERVIEQLSDQSEEAGMIVVGDALTEEQAERWKALQALLLASKSESENESNAEESKGESLGEAEQKSDVDRSEAGSNAGREHSDTEVMQAVTPEQIAEAEAQKATSSEEAKGKAKKKRRRKKKN